MTIRELLTRIGLLDPKPDGIEQLALACTDRTGHVSRRAFLGLLATAAVAAQIDPEKLLWTPGETGIVLPTATEAAVYGARNPFVTPTWIVKEMARLVNQQLAMVATVNRRHDETFKIGHEVRIKRVDPSPVLISDQLSVTVHAENMQARLERGSDPHDISRQFLAPAAAELARMARQRRLDTFVPLELPPYAAGRVEAAVNIQKSDDSGVPVRGILAQDYGIDGAPVMMRFDILGGSTTPRKNDAS